MAYHNSNGGNNAVGGSLCGIAGEVGSNEYSDDERDSRSGEERANSDAHDKPIYLLEHLATFTVNKESGIIYPADGMRRLLQLEKTTGIWSQKMQLCLDYQWVLIMDYETGNIIERFPAALIQEPTAFTSTDAMELYNNILVFIVTGGSGSRSEMHIFQSQNVSAVHLVEDLKTLRSGKMVTQQREDILQQHHQLGQKGGSGTPTSGMPKPLPASSIREQQVQQLHNHHSGGIITPSRNSIDQYGLHVRNPMTETSGGGGGGNGETDSEQGALNDETSSTSSDKYERDVTVLNHCFDDIEKFIARLQHAAAASRELERRRRNRKTKKKDPGEGLLTLRTRPPHEKEFIDIFAKFKLSFNLLAKLKAHIHDPNAPELVHFLFTPLALIVEASSDTYYESQLPTRVVNPLLTREAINLLINCVTSKETELWRSLGDAWIIPRDQWKNDVGSYHPVFMDGWSPDFLVIDELETPSTPTNISKRRLESQANLHAPHGGHSGVNGRLEGVSNNLSGASLHIAQPDEYETNAPSEKYAGNYERGGDRLAAACGIGSAAEGVPGDFSTRSEISVDSIERNVPGPHGLPVNNNNAPGIQEIAIGMQQLHTRDSRSNVGVRNMNVVSELSGRENNTNDEQMLEAWLEDLQAAGAKIVLVTYPRTANNDKELSVVRGEYLEILDDTRKWWKARNIRGQVAHVPHTIVTPFNYGDESNSNQFYGQQVQPHQQGSSYAPLRPAVNTILSNNIETHRSQDTTDWIRNKHLGKKGEFRYF
ncbi:PREDICTED: epidermal growth factor receptor kinase substrate 8-like protein 2 isoform X1 [Rhagoletis zephyria]|uniref:epidermal growth factor receptor kinase substrate 8-like protein 2 isoform X1 n=1 Tax=Rhagoletis zephyria TaxID=28612 RepID=UPI0008115E15|nr:PREDICTED: epidermal growth factor receptor kinase substrate 8-like protein 2 isoform X1 [Rhagoletis zephyria]XP_017466298.1 PREDICTED: epidermal growth factor receptor kinase substrate 8-like protein 2 isoform X1 [Rhagoletis zephyria]XP_017466299.1 PREDICTED: epidermal growth factor receptor kinase substrate 8-like protein 2 isoform X1 [Rhagoletis zephyria]XP_017466300.1 PREDICTED: epidermal growth factor receptor kinase substrate 8-like protein 2 isoform X1 [Rhagoletis zephyria]XP_01746630